MQYICKAVAQQLQDQYLTLARTCTQGSVCPETGFWLQDRLVNDLAGYQKLLQHLHEYI